MSDTLCKVRLFPRLQRRLGRRLAKGEQARPRARPGGEKERIEGEGEVFLRERHAVGEESLEGAHEKSTPAYLKRPRKVSAKGDFLSGAAVLAGEERGGKEK